MEGQGGEVRRVHIVYFLSRKGRIEHPHLIRVHHLSRNGVRLRDVKRWLGELRGKEIPESFCWSYKRRYKTGYVWQDLLDDDLITPISDNEYVLKGSEISSIDTKDFSYAEEKVGKQKDQPSQEQDEKALNKEENHIPTKSSSEIEEESPSFGSETSTLTDDSVRVEVEKTKQEKPISKGSSLSFCSTLLSKKRSKSLVIDDTTKTTRKTNDAVDSCKNSSAEEEKSKSKNSSNSASKMLKNLISCGDVETKNSTVVQMKKQIKPLLSTCSSEMPHVNPAAICKRDSFGGSERLIGNTTWTQLQFSTRMSFDGIEGLSKSKSKREPKATRGVYKPVNGPHCSQCGKQFKPEKMHGHMKSCTGLKALSKFSAEKKDQQNSDKPKITSREAEANHLHY